MNVLIIEDEFSLADAVAETLKNENFNVTIKTNGEDGEDEALTENYDLILLDVMLPGKNGFDILKVGDSVVVITKDNKFTTITDIVETV